MREKKQFFESLGLKIHVLWEVPLEKKGLSSSGIREVMVRDKEWEHLIPSSVAKLIKKWDIISRLKEISRTHKSNQKYNKK